MAERIEGRGWGGLGFIPLHGRRMGRVGARRHGHGLHMALFWAVIARLKIAKTRHSTACTAAYRFGGGQTLENGARPLGHPHPPKERPSLARNWMALSWYIFCRTLSGSA